VRNVAVLPSSPKVRTAPRRGRSAWRAVRVAVVCATVMVAAPGFVGSSSGSSDAGTLSIFAGTGTEGSPTPGPATSSDLDAPADVAVDSLGNVYISDIDSALVVKVTPAGNLSIFAGTGTYGTPTPGPATNSMLRFPSGITVDAADNVYIVDKQSYRVLKVTPGGVLSIVAGNGTSGDPTPGPATSSPFVEPVSVAVDAAGNLFIADEGSCRVLKVTTGGTLSVFAGTGSCGASTPGPATDSAMMPFAVATDTSGNVYIAEGISRQLLKVAPDGSLSVIAGTGNPGVPTPGPATSSELGEPYNLTVTAAGTVYFADYSNSMVLKVTPDGTLSIVAGTGTRGTPTPGPATSSNLNRPWSVGVDSVENVYIADTGNHVVSKVSSGVTPEVPNPESPSDPPSLPEETTSTTPPAVPAAAVTPRFTG
jgi:sugar lactone lactonase YvrE